MTVEPVAHHDETLPKAVRGSGYYKYYVVAMLGLTFGFSSLDRVIISVLLEPIRLDFALTDTQMGLLTGLAFAFFSAIAVIPLGMLADRSNRSKLVASCLAIWSLMTALGGFTTSYIQLLITRIVVGIGEGGCSPASLSIIADTFPAGKRATATSIYYIFAPIGGIVALGLGAWLAGHYGWRITLIAVGLPGLILALIIFITLKEPQRGLMDNHSATGQSPTSLRVAWAEMIRQPSLRHIAIGITLISFFISGISTWTVTFFIRSYHVGLETIGPILALFHVLGLIGPLLGGPLSDRLAKLDQRWWCWLIAISMLVAGCAHLLVTTSSTPMVAYIGVGIYSFAVSVWYGPSYGMVQTLAPVQSRTTVVATITMLTNVVGYGLGTQFVGLVSDALAPVYQQDSLRVALMCLVAVALWAAAHFMLASRSFRSDMQSGLDNARVQ